LKVYGKKCGCSNSNSGVGKQNSRLIIGSCI